jgi:hypothetical protein
MSHLTKMLIHRLVADAFLAVEVRWPASVSYRDERVVIRPGRLVALPVSKSKAELAR